MWRSLPSPDRALHRWGCPHQTSVSVEGDRDMVLEPCWETLKSSLKFTPYFSLKSSSGADLRGQSPTTGSVKNRWMWVNDFPTSSACGSSSGALFPFDTWVTDALRNIIFSVYANSVAKRLLQKLRTSGSVSVPPLQWMSVLIHCNQRLPTAWRSP